jgi:hypothetical protein
MNEQIKLALRAARKSYGHLAKRENLHTSNTGRLGKEAANHLITALLLKEEPVMIARLGAVELSCIANFKTINSGSRNVLDYITFKSEAFWWDQNTIAQMANNAGFFPPDIAMLERFAMLMMYDMKSVDVLGSWLWQEKLFSEELSKAQRITLKDLEPYYHQNPWSLALKDKKVLVIHPFAKSIQKQYQKKDLLFSGRKILPDFDLITLKAVQSIASNKTAYSDWFHALDDMKEKVSATEFDIAIIGCGAYGFPLAAHVKRIGKKAVHLGGATQTLFGIRGKRWEEKKEHQYVASLINDHWIRPDEEETPNGTERIEGACYW